MDKIKLKRLWTDVAQGKISEKEARDIIKKEKVVQNGLKQTKTKNTHKRKGLTKSREVK